MGSFNEIVEASSEDRSFNNNTSHLIYLHVSALIQSERNSTLPETTEIDRCDGAAEKDCGQPRRLFVL